MGLLRALSSLFGRSGGAAGGGQTTPPERFEHRGERSRHGRHWDALVAPEGRDTAVRGLTMRTVNRGEEVASSGGVTGYRLGDGPLATVAVTADGQIATAYPVALGPDHEVATAIHEELGGLDARVDVDVGDRELVGFAANYFAHSRRSIAGRHSASLALLCYALGPADATAGADGSHGVDGPAAATALEPWDRGAPDDYRFRATVEAVEPVSHGGYDAYRVAVPLGGTRGEGSIALLVGRHLLAGYEPRAGDEVAGAGWLQVWID